jgi:YaiO family outer membrane protein
MRTALWAGLVAGSVLLQAAAAFAGEGSSLRGLKPPRDALTSESVAAVATSSEGVKWQAAENTPDLAPRLSLYTGTLETQRFNSGNASVSSGRYRPLGAASTPLGAGNLDPLHNTLPKYAVYSQVNQALPGGWGLGFGMRQSEYNFATSNLLSFSAERYFGHFRGAYTLYSNVTDGTALASAHRFQVSYFYGERNTIGLAYTTGRDIDHLGLGVALPLNDARDLTLSGRHWFSPNWALTYDVLSQEQGTLARRQGLRLGVRRTF